MIFKRISEKYKEYHFELRHLTVLFIILFSFQLIVSLINKASVKNFLNTTQEWYQKDSAEKLANLTTTTFELLLESINRDAITDENNASRIIQSMDIIFNQQILQHNLSSISILVNINDTTYAVDDGRTFFNLLYSPGHPRPTKIVSEPSTLARYDSLRASGFKREQIYTFIEGKQTFHTYVPLVVRGEYLGALYMRNSPDFSFITNQVISNYDETSAIYLSLIMLGLLAMYFISTYTMKERDETQKLFFVETENNIKKQLNYEKEMVFTKRIYHTHHKAEKVMGFIKEDLRQLSPDNIDDVKKRVTRYSNFVSRVIYDMKWYDPPVHTYRNIVFRTNLNDVLTFIVENIFLRVADRANMPKFNMELDPNLPPVDINEFVCWEILEPLIQNSIEHNGNPNINITITTHYNEDSKKLILKIIDDGKGVLPELLLRNDKGIKKIFEENVTTKQLEFSNSGYGCYIAFEICKRCGWHLDVENLSAGGCQFIITIQK